MNTSKALAPATNQPTNQRSSTNFSPTNQPIHQHPANRHPPASLERSTNQPTKQPSNQPTLWKPPPVAQQTFHQPTNQPTNQPPTGFGPCATLLHHHPPCGETRKWFCGRMCVADGRVSQSLRRCSCDVCSIKGGYPTLLSRLMGGMI